MPLIFLALIILLFRGFSYFDFDNKINEKINKVIYVILDFSLIS